MDLRATKTHSERQDEESERLVRPSPKLKPPRHDRRRERMKVDSDPDTDEKDPDESLNYKDIGGSTSRVVRRFLAKAERVKVRKRDTGRTVLVTEKALKEKPGEYEALKDEDEGKPKPEAEEKAPVSQVRQKKPEPEGERDLGSLSAELQSTLKKNKDLRKELKKFSPGQFYHGFVQHNPDFKLSQFPWSKDLPASLQDATMGDLAKVLRTKPSAKQEKPKPEPKPKVEEPKPEPAPEAKPEEPVDVTDDAKLLREPKPKAPKSKKKAPKGKPDKKERARAEKKQKIEERKQLKRDKIQQEVGEAQPSRRKVSDSERFSAQMRLTEVFPPRVATKLIQADLHPDDISSLIRSYQAVASRPPADLGGFLARVSGSYREDPTLVSPPKTGKDYSGQEKPFNELSPEDRAEAYRQHQLRTVAVSLAAKQMVSDHLETHLRGASGETREQVAKVLLAPKGEKREALSRKLSDRTFNQTLEGSRTIYSGGDVRKVLGLLRDNPDAQRVAVAHFQANDYLLAKDVFISKGPGLLGSAVRLIRGLVKGTPADSEAETFQQISEFDSPGRIAKGLGTAKKFFDGVASRYPEDLRSERDPSDLFKRRVLSRIESLAPDKYVATKLHLEEAESNAYEKAQADYKKQKAAWDKLREKARAKALGRGSPYRDKPVDDESLPIPPPPQPPVKPEHYDRTRSPETMQGLQSRLLEEHFAQFGQKAASKVATRFLLISTYPSHSLMASVSEKSAVYHGVAPYQGTRDYPDWNQPHQRDFGESDYEVILGSANEWLQTPVLSGQFEGVPKDAQLRAALDLAIYDGPYNGAITARTYNNLLARLAGVSEEETLLTIKEGSSSEELVSMKASAEIRKLAAKYAAQNASMAYDLMELASKVAQDEQDDDEEKQGQEQQKKEAATEKYAALRSAVIKAAQAHPQARPAFLPVLHTIKNLG